MAMIDLDPQNVVHALNAAGMNNSYELLKEIAVNLGCEFDGMTGWSAQTPDSTSKPLTSAYVRASNIFMTADTQAREDSRLIGAVVKVENVNGIIWLRLYDHNGAGVGVTLDAQVWEYITAVSL